ncbi:MAG: hypothetical protein ACI90Z_000118 [Cyanobium sp.]|jgi:hypothetical protein
MNVRRTIDPHYKATRQTLAERRAMDRRRQLERVDPPLAWTLTGPAWPCCPDLAPADVPSTLNKNGSRHDGRLSRVTPLVGGQAADVMGMGAVDRHQSVDIEADQLIAADPVPGTAENLHRCDF